MPLSVTVVIPAYNEQNGVREVVQSVAQVLREAGISNEILVVDDGSTDSTAAVAESAGAAVIRHESNRGYGASLKTGITAAQNELIAITDADGTYPAESLPELIAAAEHADMVVGARIGINTQVPLARRPAKWLLTVLASYVSRAKISDLNSGLRVFWRGAAEQYFNILPDQFSFTSTLTVALHSDRYAVRYIPINYRRRIGQSKIVPSDAGAFALLIFRTAILFKPLRVFVPIAIASLAYGLLKGTRDYVLNGFISPSAVLATMGSMQFLLFGLLADALAVRLSRVAGQVPWARRTATRSQPPARKLEEVSRE